MSKVIEYTKTRTLEDVVNDGFRTMKQEGAEGFDYIIGEVNGGKLKVVFEPEGSHESSCIDGVDGFGYCLAFEVDDKEKLPNPSIGSDEVIALLRRVVFEENAPVGMEIGNHLVKLVRRGKCPDTGTVVNVVDCGNQFWLDEEIVISERDFEQLRNKK